MQPKSPIEKAFCLSRLFYCWTVPLLWLGTRRELEQDDIPQVLDSDMAESLGDGLNGFWNKEIGRPNPSLFRALVCMFGLRFLFNVLIVLFQQSVIRLSIPIVLGMLIRYMEGLYSDRVGYLLAALFIGLSFLSTILFHRCSFSIQHTGMKIRVTLTTLVHQKVLRLSQSSVSMTGLGQLTNIISNDVNRFDQGMEHLPFLLVGPVQIILVTFILWHYTGIACLSGAAVIGLLLLTQGSIGRYFGQLRSSIAKKTDTRVRRVNEVVESILLIKLSAWEEVFGQVVTEARREEVKPIQTRARLIALDISIFEISSKLSVVAIFVTLVFLNRPLTPELVFVTLATFNSIIASTGIYFPEAISSVSEVLISIRRIQKVLLLDEKPAAESNESENSLPFIGIQANLISAKWLPTSNNLTLNDVSVEARMGQLIGIVGHVGSGKSSVLQAMMGELPVSSGSVSRRGRLAYAPQEPWIFSATIRDNITFGLPLDKAWYDQVIHSCALLTDFLIFPYGDQTFVGDKGITLSGGQKARVSLARAVYSKSDIYLLDDPLSAVDVKVARHLMDHCIGGVLKGKCILLVTHQTKFLQGATEVIEMKNGAISARGSFSDVLGLAMDDSVEKNIPLGIDDIEMDEMENDPNLPESDEVIGKGEESVVVTFERRETEEETRSSGRINWGVYKEYLRAGNSALSLVITLLVCIVAQAGLNGSDFWLKKWTDHEALVLLQTSNPEIVFLAQENSSNSDYAYSIDPLRSEGQWKDLLIYCLIVLATFGVVTLRALRVFNGLVNSSIALHNRLLAAILRAPMSFFESNSSGRILNRFSNDVGRLDELVPTQIFVSLAAGTEMLGSMFLVVLMGYELLIPTSVQLIIIYFLARTYVRPAAVIKRLEGIARSPVMSQVGTALSGLAVIRSFATQSFFTNLFMAHQNKHTATFYAYIVTIRWLKFTLELLANFYTALVLIYFLFTAHSPSSFGLALSAAMTLTLTLSASLSNTAESINQLVSAERVIEYTNIKPEAPLTLESKVNPAWPESGHIQMNQLGVAYKNGQNVLQDVTLEIQAGEKIGIIGRTGAGKSSLISTLFRTVELAEGELLIDGLDVAKMGLHDLRPKISIIPQNPVLFQGTLRRNLDPLNKYLDDELWAALETVQLTARIRSSSDSGLYSEVSEAGSNFSQGERQLICLARTVLSGNKIIVLDEATANIDTKTDFIIQEAIRKKFRHATVLTVAHRLETVMDNDKILVLDAGRVKEFGAPLKLLEDEGSYLRALVQKTETSTAAKLWSIAKSVDAARN